MKAAYVLTIAMAMVMASATVALAGHINLPVKWSQLPDMNQGVDKYSVHLGNAVCSNDWQCTSPEPVVAVRWWGSYLDGHDPGSGPNQVPFELVLHWDVPANTVSPDSGEVLAYSHPGNNGPLPVWFNLSVQEHFYGTTAGGEKVYEYNVRLGYPYFDQQAWIDNYFNPVPNNNIFWLDIGYADLDASQHAKHVWGWHEANVLQLDNAISNPALHFLPWANVTVLNKDLAFELMTPEPATLALLGLGAVATLIRRRRSR